MSTVIEYRLLPAAIAVALAWWSAPARAEPDIRTQIWTQPSGRGVAIGADNGLWGGRMGTGLRVRVPVGEHFSVDVRPMVINGIGTEPYRLDVLGRLELNGATSVIFNVLRIYGGGGVHLGASATGVMSRKLLVGVGGHIGLETFLGPSMSFYFEIGGNGGNDEFFAGGTAMGGVLFYL